MPLAGGAFLALWNDIAPAREAEYDRWHSQEHVPERVAVPGIRGGRRYVNRLRDQHRYFTLYELDDLAVLDTPEYLDLVDHPTPWSASMRPDFANFVRVPCSVQPGIVGVHCGAGSVSPATSAWQTDRAAPGMRAFDRVVVIDALDRASAAAALAAMANALGLANRAPDFGADVYDLAFLFPGHTPADRAAFRRPGWPLSGT